MYVCVCRMVHVCEHIPTTPDILQCRAVRSEHTDRSVETMKSRKSPLRDVHETLSSLLYMADRAVQEPTLPPPVRCHITHFLNLTLQPHCGCGKGWDQERKGKKKKNGWDVSQFSQPASQSEGQRSGWGLRFVSSV